MREIKWVSNSQDFDLRLLDAEWFPVMWPVHSKFNWRLLISVLLHPCYSLSGIWDPWASQGSWCCSCFCISVTYTLPLGTSNSCALTKWKLFQSVIGSGDVIARYHFDLKLLHLRDGNSLILLQWYRALCGGCHCCYTELASSSVSSFLFFFSFLFLLF